MESKTCQHKIFFKCTKCFDCSRQIQETFAIEQLPVNINKNVENGFRGNYTHTTW